MRLISFVAATAMLSASLAAHADSLFTLTTTQDTISFTLPTPLATEFTGNYFYVFNVPVTADGTTTVENLEFDVPSAYGRDLIILAFDPNDPSAGDTFLLLQQGPQLFMGSAADPAFVDGSYQLSQVPASGIAYTGDFDLTISSVTPEPSSIALFGTGMFGVAGVMRKRFAVQKRLPIVAWP